MLTIKIEGSGLGRIKARLEAVQSRKRETAAKVSESLVRNNRAAAFAGLDRFGKRMPPRAKPRRDGARGAVMAPHHSGSRRVANFSAPITISRFGWRVAAGWSGDVGFFRYHAEGRVIGAPLRDILGPTPAAQQEAFDIIRQGMRV